MKNTSFLLCLGLIGFLFWRLSGAGLVQGLVFSLMDFSSLKLNFGFENSEVDNDFSLRITVS